jgi:hypothetical protein
VIIEYSESGFPEAPSDTPPAPGTSTKPAAPATDEKAAQELLSGLISWWKADGDTRDAQGQNNAQGGGQTYGPGKSGQAFHFNGVNQSVVAPANASLDKWTEFTLAAWVKLDKTEDVPGGAPGRMVFNRVGSATDKARFNQGFQFGFVYNATRLILAFNKEGQAWPGYVTEAVFPKPAPTNEWLHIAATYDRNAVKIFLNGVLQATKVIGPVTVAHSISSFRIAMDDNGNCPFAGSVDDVRIYRRALSEAEIARLGLK